MPDDLKHQQYIARALRDEAAAHGRHEEALAHNRDAIQLGIERVQSEGANLVAEFESKLPRKDRLS